MWEQQQLTPNKLAIFLPESFEWLILMSGLIKVEFAVLDHTEDYADSRRFMSWEQFYTDLLRTLTRDIDYMRYRKESLPDYYLHEGSVAKIKEQIKGIRLADED